MSPDPLRPVPLDHVAFEFIVPGAPDRDRAFALEVAAQLPEEARIWLEAPTALLHALRVRSSFVPVASDRGLVACLPHGRRLLGPGLIPGGSRSRMKVLVDVPRERRRSGGEVSVRQLYGRFEVGRVMFRVTPPPVLP